MPAHVLQGLQNFGGGLAQGLPGLGVGLLGGNAPTSTAGAIGLGVGSALPQILASLVDRNQRQPIAGPALDKMKMQMLLAKILGQTGQGGGGGGGAKTIQQLTNAQVTTPTTEPFDLTNLSSVFNSNRLDPERFGGSPFGLRF